MILPLLLVVLLAGIVWCTQNPDHPWIAEAQEWPVVGPWVAGFRVAYLGPRAAGAEEEATKSIGETVADATSEPIGITGRSSRGEVDSEQHTRVPAERSRLASALEISALEQAKSEPVQSWVGPQRAPDPAGIQEGRTPQPPSPVAVAIPVAIPFIALEWRWFLPGQVLYSNPSLDAETDEPLDAMAYLPVIDRDGVWLKVLLAGESRWVNSTWQPDHSRKRARRGILRHRYNPVQANSYQKLSVVKEILQLDRSSQKLGAYSLWTDVADVDLLGFLDSAASVAEDAYFARYGRLPSGDPQRSIVLFRERATYQAYSEKSYGSLISGSGGHAGQGVAVFFVAQRSRRNLTRTLVHEICHLLNSRALAWVLPPWLEEGLASDLGALWIEKEPGAAPDLEGDDLFSQGHVFRLLVLEGLIEKGQLHSLAVLLNLDQETFYRPDVVSYAYAYSAVFVTFLLDDDGPRADAFREYLHQIAVGRTADLFKILGKKGPEVEQEFLSWVQQEILQNRENLGRIELRYRGR